MANYKIEFWMTDISEMETEEFETKADAQARWDVLWAPATRALATNVYHKDSNGDWQPGLDA
tara:strand:+ start:379 stop:564 length:186 start_codon:yes stop_codon:yes gene_type:complete